ATTVVFLPLIRVIVLGFFADQEHYPRTVAGETTTAFFCGPSAAHVSPVTDWGTIGNAGRRAARTGPVGVPPHTSGARGGPGSAPRRTSRAPPGRHGVNRRSEDETQ